VVPGGAGERRGDARAEGALLRRRATSSWDFVHLGVGLLSATLGVAIAASGIAGRTVAIVAWIAVAAGLVLIGVGIRRLRASHTPAEPEPTLAERATSLGARILAFKRQRDTEAPRPVGASGWLPIARFRQGTHAAGTAYDADTLELYDESFSTEIAALVGDLRSEARVGVNEAQRFLRPYRVSDIEPIGLRLIELGAARTPFRRRSRTRGRRTARDRTQV
jgi:hypothetical protein